MSAALEATLLGAVLDAEGPVLRTAAGVLIDLAGLRSEDFTDPRVRVAWSIAARLAERRRPIDAVSVFAAGKTVRAFADADLEWLSALQTSNALDRERFGEVVESMRVRLRSERLLSALSTAQAKLRESPAALSEVAGQLEGTLTEVLAGVVKDSDASEDLLSLASDWERAESGEGAPQLVPTGIEALDDLIGGMPINLNVWVGQPSVGKSALLGAVVDAQLDLGLRVGLFGLEDGSRWVTKRLMARELGMPVRSVGHAKRTEAQLNRFADAGAAYTEKLRRLTVFRHDSITIDELCRRAVSWKVHRAIDVLYVDHGGEIDHFSERIDEHRLRVGESYRRLRNLALRLQIPVVVLAHSARPLDDEERPPRLIEIAESAYIERRARMVLGLWRKQAEPDFMRVTVLKATESEPNLTVKLPRHTTAALLSRTGGERVNLLGEKQRELRAAREAREAEKAALKAAAAEAREAEKAKRRPAQASLEVES